jgi:hypothetical protein
MPLMCVVAVPFAQASLIALWAGTRKKPWSVRFAAAAAGAGWGWLVAVGVLPGIGLRSTESAGWATGLAVQCTVILAAIAAWSWQQEPVANESEGEAGGRRRLQYPVASLFAWTAVLAALLSFGRTASVLLGWSESVTEWTYFRFLPVMGVFNALYALAMLYCLAGRRRLAAGLTIAALTLFQPGALVLVFGEAGGLEPLPALLLAGTQSALLYATLVPVLAYRARIFP